jgi:hypothetical protein
VRSRLASLTFAFLLVVSFSGALLSLHDHDCAGPSDARRECPTCFLLTTGRVALVSGPLVLSLDAGSSIAAEPRPIESPARAPRHAPGAPRAPPAA